MSQTGNNFGAGPIHISNLSPLPNGVLGIGIPIMFTIGVSGSSIDLTSIQITANGESVFDGAIPGFTSQYASSSENPSSPDHGFSFSILRTGGFNTSSVLIIVTASSVDGISSTHTWSVRLTQTIVYPSLTLGVPIGDIPLSQFSGEDQTGLLADSSGLAFFSPALLEPSSNMTLDVDDIQIRTHTAEAYEWPASDNSRPFVWGPPFASPPIGAPAFPPVTMSPDYVPVLNSAIYTFLKTTHATVVGVLTSISPPGPAVQILY